MKVDKKIIEDVIQKRKEKVDKYVREMMTSCLIVDLPFMDQYYIEERVREVLHEAMKLVNFDSESLAALRKELMRANLKELISKLPAPKKFNKTKDLTEERNYRCEPLVYEAINKLLNEEMLMSEDVLIENIITEQQSHSLFLQLFGYVDAFFSLLELSTEASYDVAQKQKWSGKYKEQITFRDIDRTLREIHQEPEKPKKKK